MRSFRIVFSPQSFLRNYRNFYQLQKPDVLNDGNNFEWLNINIVSSIFARLSGVQAQSRLTSYSHNRKPWNYRSCARMHCTYLHIHETRIHLVSKYCLDFFLRFNLGYIWYFASPLRPDCQNGGLDMRFCVKQVAYRHVSFGSLWFYPVNTIPPRHHIHSSTINAIQPEILTA